MKSKKDKPKEKFVDDGRTIVDMNVDGMPWYDGSKEPNRKADKRDKGKPTRRETFKMILGAYKAMLPYLVIAICAFAAVALILWLILRTKY